MDQNVFIDLIKPYQQHYDEVNKRPFYYNPTTLDSVWELPTEILDKIKLFHTIYQQEKLSELANSSSLQQQEQQNELQQQLQQQQQSNTSAEKNAEIKEQQANQNSISAMNFNQEQSEQKEAQVNQVEQSQSDQQTNYDAEQLKTAMIAAAKFQLQKEKENQQNQKQSNKLANQSQESSSNYFSSSRSKQKQENKQRGNSSSRSSSKESRSRSRSNSKNKKISQKVQNNQGIQMNVNQQIDQEETIQTTLDQYIPRQMQQSLSRRGEQDVSKILNRPSRKQIEFSLADKYAYKEGDQEYNIWYGRHLSDTRDNVRDHKTPAETRCHSENDSGYTKADLTDRYNAYFCHHWAKGCCSEGSTCRYFHRVPVLPECMAIDNGRDIFGRQRHDKHREDRGGVGSFMFQTRSIEVKDFKTPTEGVGLITQMYEILYRHFSEWGDIEDLRYLPNQGKAIVRYVHRCMAEYAKEAMQHQGLDSGEVVNIKWFLEHQDDQNKEKYNKEHLDQLKRVVEKQQRESQYKSKLEYENHKKQLKMEKREQYLLQKKQAKEQQLAQQNLHYLNKIFENDNDDKSESSRSSSKSRSTSQKRDYEDVEQTDEQITQKEKVTSEYNSVNNNQSKPFSDTTTPIVSLFPQYGSYPDSYQEQVAAYYQQQQLAQQQFFYQQQQLNKLQQEQSQNQKQQNYQSFNAVVTVASEQPLEFKKKK